MKTFKILLLSFVFTVSFCLTGTGQNNKPKYGFLRLPLRGNAIDIHFVNLTSSSVEAIPYYYNNEDNIPDTKSRNLLFFPNHDKGNKEDFPVDVKLKPMQTYMSQDKTRVIARKFIQGVLVYNNPLTYREYVYDAKANYASYSSFMWSNGTRTEKDGRNSFKNAMEEINNLYYKIKIPLRDGKEILSFNLRLLTDSNLDVTSKEYASAPGYVQDFNNIAAMLTIVAGILTIPTNPPAGIITTLSGVAWTISGTGWMIDSDYNYTQYNLFNKGLSWLSSPFDLIAFPEDYKVKDINGKIIAIPAFDRERCTLTYFLGTNSNPQSIIVQIAGSTKGDLYIYLISKNIIKKSNIKNLFQKNKIYLKKSVTNAIEQKK